MLTFRDTSEVIELKGDLLKMITNKNYTVDLASLSDKKLMNDFAKEMHFDLKAAGKKSTRDGTLLNLLKSPGFMVSALGVSKTIVLSSDLKKLRDSNIINDEIVAIVDNLLEYKCISKK